MVEAVTAGDLNALKQMQKHGKNLLEFRDEENQSFSLLHYVAKLNNNDVAFEMAKFLLLQCTEHDNFIDA